MIKDRIKELREKNRLTISAFAKSLGISPTSASLYESGKQNPGKKTIDLRGVWSGGGVSIIRADRYSR